MAPDGSPTRIAFVWLGSKNFCKCALPWIITIVPMLISLTFVKSGPKLLYHWRMLTAKQQPEKAGTGVDDR